MKGYYPATVIDNLDPNIMGRVKIKIDQFHYQFNDDMLPWAKQSKEGTGGSSTYGKSEIPEIGSLVWVWFEDADTFMRKPFYSHDVSLSELHAHTLFEDNVKSNLGAQSNYPDVKYTYYKNGICIGVSSNTTTPEVFIYHPHASILIKANGEIDIKAGTTTLQKAVLGENLKTQLDALIDAIKLLTVTCPVGGGPSTVPINAATFTAIKNNLANASIGMLSPLLKNN